MRLLEALKKRKMQGMIPLVPDIKCFSPKEGDLMQGRNPAELAKTLEEAGVCAVSVVTEEKEFHGSMNLLKEICRTVTVPVLRKDFITCEEDLDETKAAGADGILLMVSCLGEQRLAQLYHAAVKKGLTPLVETHTEEELEFALKLGAPLVGINNRDIKVLERDDGTVRHAGSLLKNAQAELQAAGSSRCFLIVESALRDGSDVREAVKSGADAALVGTAILKASDPARMYRAMTRKCGFKICGLQEPEEVKLCVDRYVDICGFVVQYPVPVRWNLKAEQAQKLLLQVKEQGAGAAARTCMVTGGSEAEVIALAGALKPDYVQLHYKETLQETAAIADALRQEGISVIRSIPGDSASKTAMFGTDRIGAIMEKLAKTSVAAVLLDTRDAGNAAAGGGSLLDCLGEMSGPDEPSVWRPYLEETGKLLMAGGGITAENAGNVIQYLRPDILDVMTGAEDTSGRKSAQAISRLIAAAEG